MKTRKLKAADYYIASSSSELSPTNQCKLQLTQLSTRPPSWATSPLKYGWSIRSDRPSEEEFQKKKKSNPLHFSWQEWMPKCKMQVLPLQWDRRSQLISREFSS